MEEDPYCSNCRRNISAINFVTHTAYCERNIKICNLCNEPISISNEKEHLEEYHITVQCDLCGINLEKWILPEHKELCMKRQVVCEFCEGQFSYDEYPEHLEFCSSRTEKCLICKKYVMLKEKQEHTKFHRYEKKILRENSPSEIEQNIINEVISNSSISEGNVQEKVLEGKEYSHERVVVSKAESDLENRTMLATSNAANSMISGQMKETKKHYTTCHICNQDIRWIDFNTHVPSCASDAGKCSRCGEDVPSHEIKDHIFKNCKLLPKKGISHNISDLKRDTADKNGASYDAQQDLDDQDMEKCPYCQQPCSSDRIIEHKKNCSENYYDCPYCNEQIPDRDKSRHDSFDCKVLLEINSPTSYAESIYNTPGNWDKKYKSLTSDVSMSTKDRAHDSGRSYADAAKKTPFKEKDKKSECKPCCPCYKNPHLKQKHSYDCRNQKRNCFYCHEEIEVTKEDVHLNICKGFDASQNHPRPKQSSQNQSSDKGAVPKSSNFANMVKPHIGKCKFCQTILNADILVYHEKECVHQPILCEVCDATYPLKDIEKHFCKPKRGKGKRGKHDKTEENEIGFTRRIRGFLGMNNTSHSSYNNTAMIDPGYHAVNHPGYRAVDHPGYRAVDHPGYHAVDHPGYHAETSFYDRVTNQNSSWFTDPAAEVIKIPCEFCEKLYPASEIVLHETGCKPELVSLPTKKDSQNIKENKPHQPEQEFFSVERKNVVSSSRNIKKYMESNVKPGEFLEDIYHRKTVESAKDNENESVDNCSKTSTIQSVWNISSSDILEEMTDSKVLPQASSSDNVPGIEQEVKENKISKPTEDELFTSDDEMSEMLEFINEENASYTASDHNSYSQRHHKDIPENKKFLKFAKSESLQDEEPMEILHEADNGNVDLDGLRKHLPDVVSENDSHHRNKAFSIEPAENILQKEEMETTMRRSGVCRYPWENNHDLRMRYASQESQPEAPEDLEKWTKWQSKTSSNSS